LRRLLVIESPGTLRLNEHAGSDLNAESGAWKMMRWIATGAEPSQRHRQPAASAPLIPSRGPTGRD